MMSNVNGNMMMLLNVFLKRKGIDVSVNYVGGEDEVGDDL